MRPRPNEALEREEQVTDEETPRHKDLRERCRKRSQMGLGGEGSGWMFCFLFLWLSIVKGQKERFLGELVVFGGVVCFVKLVVFFLNKEIFSRVLYVFFFFHVLSE